MFGMPKSCRHLMRILGIIGVLILLSEGAAWGQSFFEEFAPGPYGIGFKTIEKYDYSRAYRAKKDYFGEIIPGERARPIQTCIWYPAEVAADEFPMVYGEYAFPYPEDEGFIDFLSGIQNRENGLLFQMFNNNGGRVLDLMSVPMMAVRDAPHLDGPFPLIVYHPHWRTSITENAVLCEYLAGCGFVVATTHPFGTTSLATTGSPTDIETMVRDKEFLLAEMRHQPYVDQNKLGALGSGSGGVTALLMQMRNSDIEAVAALCGTFTDPGQFEQIRQNPYYDSSRAQVPFLHMYCTTEDTFDLALFESLKYSSRYSVEIKDLRPQDFSDYGLLAPDPSDSMATAPELQSRAYQTVCRFVRDFFKAHLNGDEQALAFLKESPPDAGGPDFLTLSFLPGQEVPPTRQQFVDIIQNGQVELAVELYEKYRQQDPGLIFFPEAAANVIGYRFLQRGQTADAIAIFKMNADSYPKSSNVWDSLADGYIANGDSTLALECYHKVLEVLPHDTNAGDDLKETLHNNAEQGIERLKP